ncbi:MAG: hypothetical protein L0H73_16505 [Nitrococcus sp.]|nr:hypothetical protein [Nitrococcus sp.]
MYIKGDMGKGSYFLGIVRSIYWDFLAGTNSFSDEFGNSLEEPSVGIKIKPYVRQVFVNPRHEIKDGLVRILIPQRKMSEWEGMDFYISHNGDDFLIPHEALADDFSISEHDFMIDWKREGRSPNKKAINNKPARREIHIVPYAPLAFLHRDA